MRSPRLLVAAAAGSAVIGLALPATTDVEVTTAPVTLGPITHRVVATGTLQPLTSVEVGSQVSGVVQAVFADFNSIVHAGDVIARFDPTLLQSAKAETEAALEQARAACAQAQSDLAALRTAEEDARVKLTRAQALAARAIIQQADLDAAQIAMDEALADMHAGEAKVVQARAGLDEARAALDQATVNLDHTIIRSPVDGVVVERSVDVGQTLAASIQSPVLFRIAADLTRMQLLVDVDEADVASVTRGKPVAFQVETYPDETFRGTIRDVRVQPVAEETTTATTAVGSFSSPTTSAIATVVSYTAIVDVSNPRERLRPGMTAVVTFDGPRRDEVIRVPNGAVSFRPAPEVLAAIHELEPVPPDMASPPRDTNDRARELWQYDGKRFTPVAVRLGLSGDAWTEVLGGSLQPGEVLVTSAVLRRHSRL